MTGRGASGRVSVRAQGVAEVELGVWLEGVQPMKKVEA